MADDTKSDMEGCWLICMVLFVFAGAFTMCSGQ
jgi:hypothetical protein